MALTAQQLTKIPYRTLAFASKSVEVQKRPDGTVLMRSSHPLSKYGRSVCEYLANWSEKAPDRVWLAQRRGEEWESVTYRQGWMRVRAIGESLLELGLTAGCKIAILSGNSIEHGLLMMGAMAVGIAVSPITPNYSLLPTGRGRLAEIAKALRADAVFVQRFDPFHAAREIDEFANAKWISAEPHSSTIALAKLEAVEPGPAFAKAYQAVEPDMIAKILFTSGSTGSPKGVINNHRMLCCCVEMGPSVLPVTNADEYPVQVEWLPWHHTMGGNSVFNGILRSGGSLYIDPGRPTSDDFHLTVAALREISPTSMFNVPAGLALLVNALEKDPLLRQSFFKRLKRLSAGGAATPPEIVARFQQAAVETVGERIPFVAAYGTTETAPSITMTYWASEQAAELGLPMPGVELKLVPWEDRYELRVKGPNVTPGYLGRPDLTSEAFDDEGYYRVGDAVTLMDPSDASRGLRFAGRLNENFKLLNGTWVTVNDVRLAILRAATPLLQGVVIAGENRDAITILAWVNNEAAKQHAADADVLLSPTLLAKDLGVLSYLRFVLEQHNRDSHSSSRVSAMRLLADPPSMAAGEITDKGSINQRAVLQNRAALVNELYDGVEREDVVRL
jgi:feruloyl-CoA synthase